MYAQFSFHLFWVGDFLTRKMWYCYFYSLLLVLLQPAMKSLFAKRFASKTRDEWCKVFDGKFLAVIVVTGTLSCHSCQVHCYTG